jgi:hypothetical protein
MLGELNRGRYRALELIGDHYRRPTRELRLDAIVCNVEDDDLQWVCDRMYHFVLKLLEEADYDPASDETPEIID